MIPWIQPMFLPCNDRTDMMHCLLQCLMRSPVAASQVEVEAIRSLCGPDHRGGEEKGRKDVGMPLRMTLGSF
jgi:hypothetical protein